MRLAQVKMPNSVVSLEFSPSHMFSRGISTEVMHSRVRAHSVKEGSTFFEGFVDLDILLLG